MICIFVGSFGIFHAVVAACGSFIFLLVVVRHLQFCNSILADMLPCVSLITFRNIVFLAI